jgi:hypothetical protein
MVQYARVGHVLTAETASNHNFPFRVASLLVFYCIPYQVLLLFVFILSLLPFSFVCFTFITHCDVFRDPIRPDFPGTVSVLWILQSSVPVSRQIRFGTLNVPALFQVIKLEIGDVPILAGQYRFWELCSLSRPIYGGSQICIVFRNFWITLTNRSKVFSALVSPSFVHIYNLPRYLILPY